MKNRNVNQKEINLQEEEKKQGSSFWKYFWGTIIVLLVLFLGANYMAFNKINTSKNKETLKNKETFIEEIISKFQKKYPNIMKIVATLDEKSKYQIYNLVDEEINKIYAPVYSHIDDFVDFHFSVTGEYSELGTILFGKIDNLLQEKIFKPANFDKRLAQAQENIEKGVKLILADNFDELKDKLKDEGFSNKEIDLLFNDILKISRSQLQERFENREYNLLRGIGVGSAAVMGALIAKKTSQVIAKKLTTKIAAKIAAKTGGKLALKIAGAGSGAAAGAEAGLLCGPGAWICSPIAGVIGGIVGWFATDKIVVEIDKYFNEDEFRNELIKLIDTQKQETKEVYYKLFSLSFEQTNKELIEKFEALKNKSILNNLK